MQNNLFTTIKHRKSFMKINNSEKNQRKIIHNGDCTKFDKFIHQHFLASLEGKYLSCFAQF